MSFLSVDLHDVVVGTRYSTELTYWLLHLQFSSKVISCDETKEPIVEYGKTTKFEGYAITLENTILFPAGGGQVI